LREHGHDAVVAQTLGLEAAADEEHLLLAADRRWTLVTHNKRDFVLLHGAWRVWTVAWDVKRSHHGIVIIPTAWNTDRAAAQLAELALDRDFTDELHIGHVHGDWRHVP
jgi:hypothetical protein